MIIRKHPTDGLKGQKIIAQGVALGYVLYAPPGRSSQSNFIFEKKTSARHFFLTLNS